MLTRISRGLGRSGKSWEQRSDQNFRAVRTAAGASFSGWRRSLPVRLRRRLWVKAVPRHSEAKDMPYGSEKMFGLVADIESYPKFIPWCSGARISSRRQLEDREIVDGRTIGFNQGVSGKDCFGRVAGSRILSNSRTPPERAAEATRLRMAVSRPRENSSRVEYEAEFEFRSRVLNAFAEMFLDRAVLALMSAFESRAHSLFGVAGDQS